MQPRFIKLTGLSRRNGDILFYLNCIEEIQRNLNPHGDLEYTLYGSQDSPTTVSSGNYDCSALEHLFTTEVRIQSPTTDSATEGRRVEL